MAFFLFLVFTIFYIRNDNKNYNSGTGQATNSIKNIYKINVNNEEEIDGYTFDNYDVKVNLDNK